MRQKFCGGVGGGEGLVPLQLTPPKHPRVPPARIIHIEVNNLPSGLRLRPAFAGRRSGLALRPAAAAGSKPAGAAEPAPAGALFT